MQFSAQYHYFGSKGRPNIAALDGVYSEIRNQEAKLNFSDGDPVNTARQLVELTFDYFSQNAIFVRAIRNEEPAEGQAYPAIAQDSGHVTPAGRVHQQLDRPGVTSGAFRRRTDAAHLFLTTAALSGHHLINAATNPGRGCRAEQSGECDPRRHWATSEPVAHSGSDPDGARKIANLPPMDL